MRKKCKNCTHFYVSKKEHSWCMKQLQYTNVDGCCGEYKSKRRISLATMALALSAVALVFSLVRLVLLF